MKNGNYERLADALNQIPNGFPRTPSNVEILLLQKIFSPEEAEILGQLSGTMEPVDEIAARLGWAIKDTRAALMSLVKEGAVWLDRKAKPPCFRLAPFIVGIYEAQLHRMDHELAHLFEAYMADGGAVGIMQPHPALHRVLPAHRSVPPEWVMPYEDVRAILESNQSFSVHDCICRVQQDFAGNRRCDFLLAACMTFSPHERTPGPDDISRSEALALLDQVEEVGLVHTVSNVAEGIGYICNCCGCCCGILRGITDWGIENSVAYAHYYAVIDPDMCTGCGACVERCQVGAIAEQEGVSIVEQDRCIGCGLCVTGCPSAAAQLKRKPGDEIVPPPANYATWEKERLHHRG